MNEEYDNHLMDAMRYYLHNCRCLNDVPNIFADFNSETPETIIHVPKTDFTDLAIEAIVDHSLNS